MGPFLITKGMATKINVPSAGEFEVIHLPTQLTLMKSVKGLPVLLVNVTLLLIVSV